jgi:hypothetical protein
LSTTVLTGMTGISLRMQWPLTFQSNGKYLSKRTIGFFVMDQTPCPYPTRSLPTLFWHCFEWSTVWVFIEPLMSEEIWPDRGLSLGLRNDTPALYPLLHELMLYLHMC